MWSLVNSGMFLMTSEKYIRVWPFKYDYELWLFYNKMQLEITLKLFLTSFFGYSLIEGSLIEGFTKKSHHKAIKVNLQM